MKLKVLITILLSASLYQFACASEKPTASHKTVIKYFMEGYLHNDYKKLEAILSNDAVFTSNRDVRVIKHSKMDVIDQMKKEESIDQQECRISSTIISATGALVIARVDVDYQLFDGHQQNFIIIEKDKRGSWKITSIYKMFLCNGNNPDLEI